MPHLTELERSKMERFVDALCRSTDETLIYINIGGNNPLELEEALNALYVDNTRQFELVEVKRARNLIGVLVCMKPKTAPVKF